MEYLWLYLSAGLSAGLLSAVAGHGGALLLLPVVSLTLDARQTVGAVLIYFIVQNILRLFLYYRYIDYRAVMWLSTGALPTVFGGIFLLDVLNASALKLIIAVVIILFVIYTYIKKPAIQSSLTYKPAWLLAVGLPYGFLSGLLSSGSIVRTPFLVRFGFLKEAFIATTSLSSLFVNIPKLYFYHDLGYLGSHNLPVALAVATGGIGGTLLGKMVLARVPVRLFYHLLNGMLIVLALNTGIVSIIALFMEKT